MLCAPALIVVFICCVSIIGITYHVRLLYPIAPILENNTPQAFTFALVAVSLAMYCAEWQKHIAVRRYSALFAINVSFKYYYRYDSIPSIYGTPRNERCKFSVTNKTPSEYIREGFFISCYQIRCYRSFAVYFVRLF